MWNNIILSILLIFVSNTYGKFRYDYTYNKEVNGWLKFHIVPATFKDAFLRCDFEGAILASPINKNLHKALLDLQTKQNKKCGMYTGIHSTISHGDYTTVDGIPLAQIPIQWAENEPDNFEDQEDCLIMLSDGTLADVRCNETFSYACYKQKTKNLVLTECGTIDPDYKLDKRTGSCYKFHRLGMTWNRGQMVCLAEGGHLAVINSPTEALVIKDLFQQIKPHTIISSYNYVASVGHFNIGNDEMWYTIHGQKLEDSGYSIWSKGQPDNVIKAGLGSYCGGVFKNGELDDIWCNVKFAFICEKYPESLAADDE